MHVDVKITKTLNEEYSVTLMKQHIIELLLQEGVGVADNATVWIESEYRLDGTSEEMDHDIRIVVKWNRVCEDVINSKTEPSINNLLNLKWDRLSPGTIVTKWDLVVTTAINESTCQAFLNQMVLQRKAILAQKLGEYIVATPYQAE